MRWPVPNIVLLRAYVDFVSQQSLHEVGTEIAKACFGGGEFVGETEGIWDEVPAVRLDRNPLGLEITLGGSPGEAGGYTLEVSSRDPLGGPLPEDPESCLEVICDFSRYLAALVERIPGVVVRPGAWAGVVGVGEQAG
jgi:hypothetical protein